MSNLPKLPERETLRAFYDDALRQLVPTRPNLNFTEGFYAETAYSVFEAGYLALTDHCLGDDAPQRVHTVSAPAGGGKTTFAFALLHAVTRHAESTPDAPYGCAFVVDQITKADEVFQELDTLLPGKVAVWSSEHDRECKVREKVQQPAAVFFQDELKHYPVIVVTHKFYTGNRKHKAFNVVRSDGKFQQRALVMVDERPEEVDYFQISYQEAEEAHSELREKRPDINAQLDALLKLMVPHTFNVQPNTLKRGADEINYGAVAKELQWFMSDDATRVLSQHRQEISALDQLFGYAKALSLGHAMVVCGGTSVHFVGWQRKLALRKGVGIVLLDATADIDGVSQIVPWREHVHVPQARYGNLEIIHVPQHTTKNLKRYLKKATNQRAYVKYMETVIREHVSPGERALVVCKKDLIDVERVPSWPEGDPRFKTPEVYTTGYGWDLDGRKLCAIHWGTGIGRNEWQDADVVLLFDEFYIPRRVSIATVQGLRGHRADQGALANMATMNSRSTAVDTIAQGHRLRHTKQMALRGNGRNYDQHGVCGKQRLVVSCDAKLFLSNTTKLFPEAKITLASNDPEGSTWAHKVLQFFSKDDLPTTVTTRQLSNVLGASWREISSRVLSDDFKASLEGLGWRYVTNRGRAGSKFQRSIALALAA